MLWDSLQTLRCPFLLPSYLPTAFQGLHGEQDRNLMNCTTKCRRISTLPRRILNTDVVQWSEIMGNSISWFLPLTLAVTTACACGCASPTSRIQNRIDQLNRQLTRQECRIKEAEEAYYQHIGGEPCNAKAHRAQIARLPPQKMQRLDHLSNAIKIEEDRYGKLYQDRKRQQELLNRHEEH